MNIKRAKEEIKNCIQVYFMKDGHGEYMLPAIRQRPVLLMGPPGIGKTQIMEQIARECRVGLVIWETRILASSILNKIFILFSCSYTSSTPLLSLVFQDYTTSLSRPQAPLQPTPVR